MVCRLVCAWERKAAKEPLSDVGSDDVFEREETRRAGLHFNAIFSALADSLPAAFFWKMTLSHKMQPNQIPDCRRSHHANSLHDLAVLLLCNEYSEKIFSSFTAISCDTFTL